VLFSEEKETYWEISSKGGGKEKIFFTGDLTSEQKEEGVTAIRGKKEEILGCGRGRGVRE